MIVLVIDHSRIKGSLLPNSIVVCLSKETRFENGKRFIYLIYRVFQRSVPIGSVNLV